MNILVLSTSTNNTNTFIGSLECTLQHNVRLVRYDQKWHEAAFEAVKQNPSVRDQIMARQWHASRDRVAMDDEILMEAKIGKPDAIVYISAWQEDFVPLNETLGELNQISPVIHFLSDASDHPWWPQLAEFERRGVFSLTVAIDGGHYWPGGKSWPEQGVVATNIAGEQITIGRISNAMTLLTPIDTRYYPKSSMAYGERPYPIGYGGNNGGHVRNAVVNRLQSVRGFAFKQRDANPNSYGEYAEFLRNCRVSVSVPFTGTGSARHVKGRVVETGLAGGTLLEWANDATRSWFTPRHEYFEYSSIEECAEYAEWLAGHPRISEEMAKALQSRVIKEHAPEVFWRNVLARVTK